LSDFSRRLIRWHKRHGRHDLPWQNTTDPYRIWLSEIMLQQTQVATATPYYQRFLQRFPTLATLAHAPVGEVMALWSGLGYYARARNLHVCARVLMEQHGGQFPHHPEQLAALPGIGRSTANSIATFCFGAHAPILDGNVKRVLTRAFGIEGFPGSTAVEKKLWELAAELMPAKHGDTYIQAQMDLGATLCTRSKPRCGECPLEDTCVANATGRQAELPHKKPRAALPEREVTVLILRRDDRVLVEQRPPHGIWGGLWSLPELPDGQLAASFISSHLRCTCDTVSPAPTISHTFTHFRLQIRPLICTVTAEPQMMESGTNWLLLDTVNSLALPAPIKRLLLSLN
jgi:A/G-specific adenine glycosylase